MRFGIRTQLLASFGSVLILLLGVAAGGLIAVATLTWEVHQIGDEYLNGVYDANEAARLIMEVQADLSKLVRATSQAEQQGFIQDAREHTADFEAHFQAARQRATDPDELKRFAASEAAWRQAVPLAQRVVQTAQQG